MRRVQQQSHDDCLASCLASLLDLPLSVVPVFKRAKDGDHQLHLSQKWLSGLGYTLLDIPMGRKSKRSKWKRMAVATPAILIVKSTKHFNHAIIGTIDSGGINIIFDPSVNGDTSSDYEIVSVMFLVPGIKPGAALENLRLLRE